MKNLKKILAILLVASMILTTNATMLFATEVNQGTEEQIESNTEETTFEEEEPEDDIRRGERLSEPEEEETEAEEEAEAEEELEETTVGANASGARPEDEENSTEAKLGEPELFVAGAEEPEEETLNLENKKDNKPELYGSNVESIDIKIPPYRTSYYASNKFDPFGLVITVKYDDKEPEDIEWALNKDLFEFEPTLDTPLTMSDTEIYVKYIVAPSIYVGNSVDITVKEGTPLDPDNTFYMVLSKNKLIKIDTEGKRKDGSESYNEIIIENEIDIPAGKEIAGWYNIYMNEFTTIDEIFDEYNPNYGDMDVVTLEKLYTEWPKDTSYAGGLVFRNKSNPNPNPNPTPTYVDDDGGDDPSDPNVGPLGRQYEYTDYGSGIPSLKDDLSLLLWLMSFPENMYRQKTIARDVYGNVGYGRWLHVPGTMTWYFFVGDFDANGIKPNSGFIVSGMFKLEWNGAEKWFRFDGNAVLILGWYQEGGKIYFAKNNPLDPFYGEVAIGQQNIDGTPYNFDASGALIQ